MADFTPSLYGKYVSASILRIIRLLAYIFCIFFFGSIPPNLVFIYYNSPDGLEIADFLKRTCECFRGLNPFIGGSKGPYQQKIIKIGYLGHEI